MSMEGGWDLDDVVTDWLTPGPADRHPEGGFEPQFAMGGPIIGPGVPDPDIGEPDAASLDLFANPKPRLREEEFPECVAVSLSENAAYAANGRYVTIGELANGYNQLREAYFELDQG